MRKIKPQSVSLNQRAFLQHMIAEHAAQGRIHQMSCRMIQRNRCSIVTGYQRPD